MCLNKLRDLPDYRRSGHFSILAVGASFQMFWILIYILVFSSCTLDPLTESCLMSSQIYASILSIISVILTVYTGNLLCCFMAYTEHLSHVLSYLDRGSVQISVSYAVQTAKPLETNLWFVILGKINTTWLDLPQNFFPNYSLKTFIQTFM